MSGASPLLRATLAAVLSATPAAAAEAGFRDTFIDPYDGAFDASRYLSERSLGFLPVPVIITEPAVGGGAGLMGLFFHESEQQKHQRLEVAQESGQPVLPANVSLAGGAATENGTWVLGAGHLGFWKQDRVRYRGFAGYASVNLDFYSLGGVELPRPVELEIDGPALLNEVKFRLGDSGWFLGARQLYRHVETGLARRDEADRLPIPGMLPAADRFSAANLGRDITTSGLGLLAAYDSTTNPFDPEQGSSYSASHLWFDDAFGSDVDYRSFNLTALNYWTLADRFVVGLRVQYDGIAADDRARLPAYVPPAISLRGVSANRYQGNDVAVAEAALDYKLSFRWKIGTFIGAGRAASSFGELDDAASAVSRGVGFRYLIARRYGFVMGIDVARGPEESAFYIQAGATW